MKWLRKWASKHLDDIRFWMVVVFCIVILGLLWNWWWAIGCGLVCAAAYVIALEARYDYVLERLRSRHRGRCA